MNIAPDLFARYGLPLVFANVFAERLGLPLPAMPTLIFAGSLAAAGTVSALSVFVAAFVACVLGDTLWYAAGVRYGRRVIGFLCRVSVSPDTCVRRTEDQFAAWGRLTLVCAKFVPGLSAVVRPLAGTLRIGWWQFEFFNGIGAALWIGFSVLAGMLFHEQVNQLLTWLRDFGITTVVMLGAVAAAVIGIKVWQRRRFARIMNVSRITPAQLHELMNSPAAPLVVDVRSSATQDADPRRIPGARAVSLDQLAHVLKELPTDREVVFYCSCPNEASAAFAARRLMNLGYTRVRPLLGGLDAWTAAGFTVEGQPAAEARVDSLGASQ